MDWKGFWFLLFFSLALSLAGCAAIFWIMKKAGIQPMNYYKKLFYENVTGTRDTRTGRHRSYFQSRKGGKQTMEVAQTRGLLTLEFYTEDGAVLQRWQSGDPPVFTVELPAGVKVYQRRTMTNFTGSIIFRK